MEFIKVNNNAIIQQSQIYSGNKDQATQYYLQEGTGRYSRPDAKGICAEPVSLGATAAAAELGAIDTKNSLQIHSIDKVEKPTESKKIFGLNNVKSMYKEPTEQFNKDYFTAYYGINIQKH